jgi:aspartokinase
MGRDLQALSKVFEALAGAGIPVLLTNRSMAENNVIVGVDAARFEEAIRAIYAIFEK